MLPGLLILADTCLCKREKVLPRAARAASSPVPGTLHTIAHSCQPRGAGAPSLVIELIAIMLSRVAEGRDRAHAGLVA